MPKKSEVYDNPESKRVVKVQKENLDNGYKKEIKTNKKLYQ